MNTAPHAKIRLTNLFGWKYTFPTVFAAGLLFRLAALHPMGIEDMYVYIVWGESVRDLGLAQAYSGAYFPIQWQVFQVCTVVARCTGLYAAVVIDVCNLLFELATFALILHILAKRGVSRNYALLYWCHPWFLAMATLGYCDIHYAFFGLLTAVLADRARDWRAYLVAGIPLGIVLLMKPQPLVLVLAAIVYAAVQVLRHRAWRPTAIMAAPCLLFAAYSLYFWLNGRPIGFLAGIYLNMTDHFPCLTADMPNLWYPLAYLLKEPGTSIYAVTDQLVLAGPLDIRRAAIAITVTFLCAFAWYLGRSNDETTPEHPWILLFAFASLLLPMVMTNAHENHLFLSTILLIVILPNCERRANRLAIHVLVAIQAINIVGLYGLGENRLTESMVSVLRFWTHSTAAMAALVSTACFLSLLGHFFDSGGPQQSPIRRAVPAAIMAGLLGLLYAITYAIHGHA